MKRAFTMIELIFVIVIIGILAAVAIPKLAATRDDAKISNIVANARTVMGDMFSYYTSQGNSYWSSTGANSAFIGAVTNVALEDVSGVAIDPTTTSIGGQTFYLSDGDGNPCIQIVTTDEGNVTLTSLPVGTSVICDEVVADSAIISMTNGTAGKTTTLGGTAIKK